MKMTKIFYIKITIILFWATALFLTLVANSEVNPVLPSYKNKINFVSLIPEGWSFFTRDPREVQTLVYKEVNGKLESINHQNFSAFNSFGFGRYTRIESLELALLLASINDSLWVKNDGDIFSFYKKDLLKTHDVRNTSNTQYLAGTLILEQKEPVPWAWFQSGKDIIMPSKVIKLEVSKK
jgi:antimicrobial peptide system SdpA family protein